MNTTTNPFHHLGQIGFAACGDGAGPDEIDISTEVQNEMALAGKLVRDLLQNLPASATTAPIAQAAAQFLEAMGEEPAPPIQWRDPADAVANMRRIAQLDADGQSPMDDPMASTLAALVGQLPAVLAALEVAAQAQAALENILLHPSTRNAMTPADQKGRDTLADELRSHLDAIGA